jgi:hypothetical protein
MHEVPLDHNELMAAVQSGVFPGERHWIDFKLGLYPGRPGDAPRGPTKGEREHAHEELARDAASMAIRGGYLIYGVHEVKPEFRFEPLGMALQPGIRETVVQVVSSRTSPPLEVVTYALSAPDRTGHGFLVVEVPESPEAPHMVAGVFHGRSDIGRTTLDEPEVERLILQRHQIDDQLAEQMALTADHDPGVEHRGDAPRAYLTAIPTRGYRDMFRRFTDLQSSRQTVWPLLQKVATLVPNLVGEELEFHDYVRRGQRIEGIWHRTWDQTRAATGAAIRALGISDDGPIRLQRFQAGYALPDDDLARIVVDPTGPSAQRADTITGAITETDLLHHIQAVLQLVAVMADEVNYTGSWSIGLDVYGLKGFTSEVNLSRRTLQVAFRVQILDQDHYRQTTRVTTRELQSGPFPVADALIRPLLRGLDRENILIIASESAPSR